MYDVARANCELHGFCVAQQECALWFGTSCSSQSSASFNASCCIATQTQQMLRGYYDTLWRIFGRGSHYWRWHPLRHRAKLLSTRSERAGPMFKFTINKMTSSHSPVRRWRSDSFQCSFRQDESTTCSSHLMMILSWFMLKNRKIPSNSPKLNRTNWITVVGTEN